MTVDQASDLVPPAGFEPATHGLGTGLRSSASTGAHLRGHVGLPQLGG
jgi:hypothetical protein